MRRILFGPPGTGKTTTLIRAMEGYLRQGIPANRIGFVSFSRRAIQEAKDVAATVTKEELPYFRTIHSTAYRLLGLSPGDVLQREHLDDFGNAVGLEFHHQSWEGTDGDRILSLYTLAHARGTSPEIEWRRAMANTPWVQVARVLRMYDRFKANNGLWDFGDMIEKAEGTLNVDVLFVDEAQDNSASQWALLRRIAHEVPHVWIAGDDDQAIYQWSGADPYQLLRFHGQRDVLPVSHRLPVAIKAVADRIVHRISRRASKAYAPVGSPGHVQWVRDTDQLDLHDDRSWLLLARSNYQLRELRALARRQGVVYTLPNGAWSWSLPTVRAAMTYEAVRKGLMVPRKEARQMLNFASRHNVLPPGQEVGWAECFGARNRNLTWMEALDLLSPHDREYIRALRRSGESLTLPGRVRVGTVHSVKGAEADNVVLLTDLSKTVSDAALIDPDAELRVQYVGVTRARSSLTLVQPKSQTFWHF